MSARRVGDWSDAEGLAIAPDGTAWVSFERWAHVWKFDAVYGQPSGSRIIQRFYDHSENWQLEAAAIASDGTVYAFSEKPLLEGFPIYRLGEDALGPLTAICPNRTSLPLSELISTTNDELYLLERKLVVGLWWQNRVRRVRLDGTEDTILWTGERGEYRKSRRHFGLARCDGPASYNGFRQQWRRVTYPVRRVPLDRLSEGGISPRSR